MAGLEYMTINQALEERGTDIRSVQPSRARSTQESDSSMISQEAAAKEVVHQTVKETKREETQQALEMVDYSGMVLGAIALAGLVIFFSRN